MSLERKIRALRAKAASTTFPAERDSCNAKADALEAKLKAEQPPEPNPYTYTWAKPTDPPWEFKPQPKPERKPRRPWQGSMGEHDALYKEALERIQKELERDRPSLSPRVRDIIARRMANAEMIDRFGVD